MSTVQLAQLHTTTPYFELWYSVNINIIAYTSADLCIMTHTPDGLNFKGSVTN